MIKYSKTLGTWFKFHSEFKWYLSDHGIYRYKFQSHKNKHFENAVKVKKSPENVNRIEERLLKIIIKYSNPLPYVDHAIPLFNFMMDMENGFVE